MNKSYEVAHIHEQGQDLIIIPLEAAGINNLSEEKQFSVCDSLQFFASDAGLKGVVCLVWEVGTQFKFIAPKKWHPFFKSINMDFVNANRNRKLTCSYT